MKHPKLFITIAVLISLAVGLVSGFCIGYYPRQQEINHYKCNFEYYRDKYLNECEIYEKIINIASNQQLDDYSKLYIIRSTYVQTGRSQEIENAIKLKKSLERNIQLNND